MAKVRSVLLPAPQSLLLPLLVSGCGHGSVAFVAVLFSVVMSRCGPPKRVIDLDKTMQVSMVELPKSPSNLPTKAMRAPVPKGSKANSPPAPRPPNESDLAIKTPDAQPSKGFDSQAADDLLRELEMQDALDNLDAPIGSKNQLATDPNSTSDAQINALRAAGRGDPELAAYQAKIQRIFNQHFRPLDAVVRNNPDLLTVVHVVADNNGRVTGYRVVQSSGNVSFDRAAESASAAVTSLPLPPERYRPLMSEGYEIRFQRRL